jgi:hypothetical protein
MITEQAAKWCAQVTAERLATWIENASRTDDYRPFQCPADVGLVQCVASVVNSGYLTDRTLWADSLSLAFERWHGSLSHAAALEDYAYLASELRIVEALPSIRRAIDRQIDKGVLGADMDTVSALIAALASFAPHARVVQTLESYFCDERLSHFGAQLFTGLCSCDPDHHHRYIPQLLSTLRHAGDFEPQAILAEQVRICGASRVLRGLVALGVDHRREFAGLMARHLGEEQLAEVLKAEVLEMLDEEAGEIALSAITDALEIERYNAAGLSERQTEWSAELASRE